MAEFHLPIRAEGRYTDAREFPLTWGQANMWEATSAYGGATGVRRRLNPSRFMPAGSCLTVEQAVTGISRFVGAYDIARTTFDTARCAQVVQPMVTIPIAVSPLRTDATADGDELLSKLASSYFSLDEEPPIRFGLVSREEEVLSVVLLLSHLAFDGASWPLIARRLKRALVGTVEVTLQPEDLVRYEQSDRMQQRSDATLLRWTDSLSTLPSGCGLRPTAPGSFTECGLQSRVAAIATQTLALRAGVSATSVVLAALTMVLKLKLDNPPAAMLLVCGNRHYSDLADYPGIVSENALYVIPELKREHDFDQYLKLAEMSAIRGYARARYDSGRWRAVLTDMGSRSGVPDLSFFFNHPRTTEKAWEGLEREGDELKSWKSSNYAGVATVQGRRELSDATLFFNLWDAGLTAQFSMTCDDSLIPPAQTLSILCDLEEFLVAKAL